MQSDIIEVVGIDDNGSLWVKPKTVSIPHIYLEAMGVNWDTTQRFLCGPRPNEWSYCDWFRQILEAAKQQGIHLKTDLTTEWLNIEDDLRREIMEIAPCT